MISTLNIINPLFNYANIDRDFKIIKIISKKKGQFLSSTKLDLNECNFSSTKYDKGKIGFALMTTVAYKDLRDVEFEEGIEYKKITAKEAEECGVLVQLFINALCNKYEDYNNVTGGCYKIIEYGKSRLKTLKFDCNKYHDLYYLNCTCNNFINIKYEKNFKSMPLYCLTTDEGSLTRITKAEKGKNCYIKKGFLDDRASYKFFDFLDGSGRAYELHKIVESINKYYGNYVELNFKETEIIEKKEIRDTTITDLNFDCITRYGINFVDFINDDQYKDELLALKHDVEKYFNIKINKSKKIKKELINFAFINNSDYYDDNNIEDPHKMFDTNVVVQSITPDILSKLKVDFNNNKLSSQLNTIIKEAIIKSNIFLSDYIFIEDWKQHNFKKDFKFVLQIKYNRDDENYYKFFEMIIHPNGYFDIRMIEDDLFNFLVSNDYFDYFKKNDNPQCLVIDDEDNINMIERTNLITLPNKDCVGRMVSRSKKTAPEEFAGLLDLNYYLINNDYYYNAGKELKSINKSLPSASHLYKIKVIEGNNIVKELFNLMTLPYVTYNSFTVLPFPLKMLREYAKAQLRIYL